MAGERSYTYYAVDSDINDADQNIDALLSGYKWDVSSSNVITYGFLQQASDISYNLNPGGGSVAFSSAFSSVQEQAARDAMAMFAEVVDVIFEDAGAGVGGDDANGTLRFGNFTGISTAYGYFPFRDESAGDMAFAEGEYDTADLGTYEFATFLHEIGHAMGLEHGHETGGSGALTADKDGMEYSVMTYNSFVGQSEAPGFYTNSYGNYAQSLMMYDIAALQVKYGANWTTNDGNSVYTFSTTTGEMSINGVGQGAAADDVIFRTVWDGDGIDTYDFSNFTTRLAIDLAPGSYSDLHVGGNDLRAQLNAGWDSSGTYVGSSAHEFASGHLYNALQYQGNTDSLIENAVGGTANDELRGNSVANTLTGGKGIDMLYGLAGADKLNGGDGHDWGYGGSGADILKGQRGRDKLFGQGGHDRLEGNGGDDKLTGGGGNDTLFGGFGNDKFVFKGSANNGTDTVLDFDDGADLISIWGGTVFEDLTIAASGGDTQITWGNSEIILTGITTGIDADDFLFS